MFSILLMGLYNLSLLKTRFYCAADLPAKRLHIFHVFFIVNFRLKKHPSFKSKAFLPTRRRATLVSVFVFVKEKVIFSWILVTFANLGESIQDMLLFFLDQFAIISGMISCCLVLPL